MFTSLILSTVLLSAQASASRTVESPQSIAATVVRMSVGAVARETGEGLADALRTIVRREAKAREATGDVAVAIDGRQASGVAGWFAAAGRVAGYVADWQSAGSVGFSGSRLVRGKYVRWSVTISDGRLEIIGEAFNVQRLDHVRFTIRADEYAGGTRITGVADGRTSIGGRCGLVRRVVERAIRDGLAGPLAGLEVGGRKLYAGGDPAVVMATLVSQLGR
jgi:hypothetical protein